MLKKILSYLLCVTVASTLSINTLAANNMGSENDPKVRSYIAEKTAEIQQSIEAGMQTADGAILSISPEVKVERVGNLPVSARSVSPEDGLYRVSVYASPKEEVDEDSDLDASLTLVVYYTTSGLKVTTTKQHYSYSGSTKASVINRILGVYGDGNGILKTPSTDSGSYSISKGGIINRPIVDAKWSLKNRTSKEETFLFCRIQL